MSLEHYISQRKQLHDNPGISGNEAFAHDLIVKELNSLHPSVVYDHVGGYGVVALWKSTHPENGALAFRADTDALPIGHRCGHDGHTTIMLCFASMVDAQATKGTLRNDILLVFQPEEETGMGAKKIVDSGLLQKHNVKAVFGLHNLPGYPIGNVVLNNNTFAAASTGVIYSLSGRETHASTPEKGLNPALAVADIIRGFDSLNSYTTDIDTFRQSTLICCRVGEEAFGTSAGHAEIMFTIRAFTNAAMEKLQADTDSIVEKAAKQYGLNTERTLREPFAATENSTRLVLELKKIFEPSIPTVTISTPFRWSEDFAEYLKVFPGAFFGIGSGVDQPELHHPDYNFPDELNLPAANCFQLIMNNIII